MLLYIVRHGAPDYATDSLLDEGRHQAELVAARLKICGIDEIHASPMGRARQTAQPLADALGLDVVIEDWAHEIGEESATRYPDGKLKPVSFVHPAHFHQEKYRPLSTRQAFGEVDGFTDNAYRDRHAFVTAGLDGFLERLGYKRNAEGLYTIVAPNDRHVALFCHGGMLRILISHLFDIPVHLLAASLVAHFTGVTLISFGIGMDGGDITAPKLLTLGDIGHLYADGKPLRYAMAGEAFFF